MKRNSLKFILIILDHFKNNKTHIHFVGCAMACINYLFTVQVEEFRFIFIDKENLFAAYFIFVPQFET